MQKHKNKWMHNCAKPSEIIFHSQLHAAVGVCVWGGYWREASGEISGDALNALMQSNCFQISHWWTVSFQPFNYCHIWTHTPSNHWSVAQSLDIVITFFARPLPSDLWSWSACCIVKHWGGQDGVLIWNRKSRPEDEGSLVKADWYIAK